MLNLFSIFVLVPYREYLPEIVTFLILFKVCSLLELIAELLNLNLIEVKGLIFSEILEHFLYLLFIHLLVYFILWAVKILRTVKTFVLPVKRLAVLLDEFFQREHKVILEWVLLRGFVIMLRIGNIVLALIESELR